MSMNETLSPAGLIGAQPAGRLAVGIALTAIVSIVTLGLLYAGLPIFGPINDLTNAVSGLLSALLALHFHARLRERAPGAAGLLLAAAWIGAAAIVVNSLLVAAGQMHWTTGGMYTALGLGLQGLWLLGLHRLIAGQAPLTTGIARLGSMAGIAMLFGLFGGPLLAAGVDLASHPLVTVAYVGAAAGWLLYPLWCGLVGWRLLSA